MESKKIISNSLKMKINKIQPKKKNKVFENARKKVVDYTKIKLNFEPNFYFK